MLLRAWLLLTAEWLAQGLKRRRCGARPGVVLLRMVRGMLVVLPQKSSGGGERLAGVRGVAMVVLRVECESSVRRVTLQRRRGLVLGRDVRWWLLLGRGHGRGLGVAVSDVPGSDVLRHGRDGDR